MRAVVQRVSRARVTVDGAEVGAIGPGLLVYLGVANEDGPADVQYIASKVRELRIFEDDRGRMNRSLGEAGGAILLVSQFTLCGDCRRGRRPSFDGAAPPELARALYEAVARAMREAGADGRDRQLPGAHGRRVGQRRPGDAARGQREGVLGRARRGPRSRGAGLSGPPRSDGAGVWGEAPSEQEERCQ